jgi:hypothetical protein
MARYDKYDPISGGFRAPLAAAITAPADIGVPRAVGVDANGRVVFGSGVTGVIGILVADQAKAANEIVDVMTAGEIVDLDEANFDPGQKLLGQSAGAVNTTAGGVQVGFTIRDTAITTGVVRSRFVVRVRVVAT